MNQASLLDVGEKTLAMLCCVKPDEFGGVPGMIPSDFTAYCVVVWSSVTVPARSIRAP
ncbi:MAG: hypothetical protein U0841_05130 [Chloroflexia bacterium]